MVGPGRVRPKMVKVRRQLRGRSKEGLSGELASGFNPFQSVSENSRNDADVVSNDFSNGFLEKSKDCSGSGIVFGVNGSKSSIGGKEFGDNMEKMSGTKVESLKSENVGFVFGIKEIMGEDERNTVSNAENRKPNNGGFVFGSKHTIMENEQNSVSNAENGKLDDVGSVFGAKWCNPALNSIEGKGFGGNVKEMSCKVEPLKTENVGFVFGAKPTIREKEQNSALNAGNGKLDDAGFVFVANGNGVNAKLNWKKGERNALKFGNLGPEVESEESYVDFELGNEGHNLGSDLNRKREESSENMSNLDSSNVRFVFSVTSHNDSGKNTGLGPDFVFGHNGLNSISSLNDGNIAAAGNPINSVSDNVERMKVPSETKFHKVQDTAFKCDINASGFFKGDGAKDVFIFGNSNKNSFSFNERKAVGTSENFNGMENAENCNFDSVIYDKHKCADSCDIASASSTVHISNLPDEMKRLNINYFENDDGAAIKKSSPTGDASFVFRSSKEASTSSSVSLDTSYETKLNGHPEFAEVADGDKFKSTDKNKTLDMASTSFGISSSESFTFQAGFASRCIEDLLSQGQVSGDTQLNGAARHVKSLFSSVDIDSQADIGMSEAPAIVGDRNKNDKSNSRSTSGGLDISFAEFEAPKWDPSCLKTSLFPDLDKKVDFSAKSRSKRDKRSVRGKLKQDKRSVRGKLKQSSLYKQHPEQDHVQTASSAQEIRNSPGCYSPMDFSPYEEPIAVKHFSSEASVISNDSFHLDNNYGASVLDSTGATGLKNEGGLDINKENEKSKEPNDKSFEHHSLKFSFGDYPSKGFVFGAEMASSCCDIDQVCSSNGSGIDPAQDAFGLKLENSNGTQFCFDSSLEETHGRKFSFSASSSSQNSSATKRLYRKKNKKKVPCEPSIVASSPNAEEHERDLSTSQRKAGNKSGAGEQEEALSSSTVRIQEECETWRLRGNQAYTNGDLSKAEVFYTNGINSVSIGKILECCIKPLVICYSNRAATRMSLGNLRGALADCATAAALDPNFLKVQIRAANCHLVLGELENAMRFFNKCLESGPVVCLDRRITIEAAYGLQKAQKVAECKDRSAKLLEQRTSNAALSALDIINEALPISLHSERLLEMKAESLFMLRKYEEVILLCEQTLSTAEKNFASVGTDDQLMDDGGSRSEIYSFPKLWRWRLISKSQFYLGKLEMALDILEKFEQMRFSSDKSANKLLESSISLATTIRDLLHQKRAGNEAVKSGRYNEAVEHYTTALSSNIESRPFAAICLCNRSAAHQALGQIADAIADCSLAIALDRNYSKAVSRRATLHEMIRDYGQAASDLERLISVLENQSNGKASQSGTPGRATSVTKELKQVRLRLCLMEEEAKKGIPLNFYLLLGVEESDTATEMKKAYRKAALRHHPDKAGQFLARSESGDEGQLWKEIVQEVHVDADRLFKMIGEAYAVLSDATKRSEYDLNEEIRKESKKNNGRSPHRTSTDAYSYPFGRHDHRQNWQDNWKTHGYSRSRW